MQAVLPHNCRDPVLFVGRLPCGGVCVAMSCGGFGFTPEVLRFCLGQRETDDWKIHRLLFSVPRRRWVVCILNFWFSSNDSSSRFKLMDKCRSEKWEVYLHGDMTIMVMESRRAESCGGLRSCISWCDGKAFFGAVYTGTRPRFPRHQGGEGVAGTPGACSQVFCHPIRCISRTRLD